jgi:hypothetical protein
MLHVQVTELPKWSGIIFLLMAISTIGKRRTESNNKEVSYLLNYHRTHLFFLLVRCMLLACRAQEYKMPSPRTPFFLLVCCVPHERSAARQLFRLDSLSRHLFFSWSAARTKSRRCGLSRRPLPPPANSQLPVQCLSPFVHLCSLRRLVPRPVPSLPHVLCSRR